METLKVLASEGLRRSFASLVAVALLIAVGVGAGLASVEIADRTEWAYPDYLRSAEVGDLVVNPSLDTVEAEEMIRSLPGVRGVASDSLLSVAVNDNQSNYLSARMSSNGRYTTQDRPVVHEGRMIRSGAEAFFSRETAVEVGVEVGDTVTLTFVTPQYSTGDGQASEITVLGSEEVQVVGIGVLSDEVLADELYPRQRVLVTPEVAAKYDCVKETPDPGDTRPLAEIFPEVIHLDCTTSYRYFSLRADGGAAGAKAAAGELTDRFRAANERLPASFRANNIGYEVIGSFTADDAERVRQSLSPVVTAMKAFGFTAGLVTVGVALLLIVRILRRREGDVAVWHSLGLPARQRALALALPPACAAAMGLVVALAVTWVASSIGPVASARAVVPHSSRGVSGAIVLPLVVIVVLFALGVAFAARRSAARPAVDAHVTSSPRRVLDGLSRSPALALGVRAATRSRGAGALLAGSVLAIAAVVATAVFSASVVHFVRTPALFGWSFDTGALVNAGYGPTDLTAVAATLDRPEVERWAIAALSGGLTVNGDSLPFIGPRDGFEEMIAPSTVVTGRLPRAADEIALGSRTAHDLGVDVGDEVAVKTPNGERTARISGLVVLPAIGPFESDRTSLGAGVLLSQAFYEALLDNAESETGMSGAELGDQFASFVAIDFASGVDRAAFMREISDQLPSWDPYQVTPAVFTDPVRPATVVDVDAMRQVPVLLAGALALTMVASLVAGISSGTRARRRELAVVRALGGTPRQIRASVRWHAIAVVAVGLVVGLPAGVVVGRLAFGAFARDLGAAPRPFVPLLLVIVTIAVVLGTGLAASVVPARRAVARRDSAEALRSHRAEVRPS
ncbi:MAG TPA: FtsX-like permease family protein [Acidimicrobiales bacterium]|nr:FtsX-like permease family protein [Acidimicrobiales bacterium]